MDRQFDNIKKSTFIEELQSRGTVFHAAKAAEISRATAYLWRKADEVFAQAWDDATANCADVLEDSAYQRALAGDTTLTIFLLKGFRPEKYRDNLKVSFEEANAVVDQWIKTHGFPVGTENHMDKQVS